MFLCYRPQILLIRGKTVHLKNHIKDINTHRRRTQKFVLQEMAPTWYHVDLLFEVVTLSKH